MRADRGERSQSDSAREHRAALSLEDLPIFWLDTSGVMPARKEDKRGAARRACNQACQIRIRLNSNLIRRRPAVARLRGQDDCATD